MTDHVVDYRASYLAARRAIIEARNRLAKGRALWNGPAHECDSVLSAFLDEPIFPDDPRDAQIAALRDFVNWIGPLLVNGRITTMAGREEGVHRARAALAATEPRARNKPE